MTGQLQPLVKNQRIVADDGTPTDYFIRWAQQRQIDIGEAIDAQQALQIVEQFLADNPLIAGSGIVFAPPSGNIADGLTISAEVQAILNQISTTRGTVLFRGATNWQALAPGTAGQFLQTQGAGADPVWATASGATGVTILAKDAALYTLPGGVTTLQVLRTYTVPANTLTADGDMLLIRVWGGLTAAGGGTRSFNVRLTEGANTVTSGLSTTVQPRSLSMEVWAVRLNSTTLRVFYRPLSNAALYTASGAIDTATSLQNSLNMTFNPANPLVIDAVGQATTAGAGAVECRLFHVELHK